MPRSTVTLNIVTFTNGKVYAEVNTGKATYLTKAGFMAWATHQVTISPNSKLAAVVFETDSTFTVQSHELTMLEAHVMRMRILRKVNATNPALVVNQLGRLQSMLNKLTDTLAADTAS